MPKHGKLGQLKWNDYHDFDTFRVQQQHGGYLGIGGTCGAKRGKLWHWG